jgi:hypothetical protein
VDVPDISLKQVSRRQNLLRKTCSTFPPIRHPRKTIFTFFGKESGPTATGRDDGAFCPLPLPIFNPHETSS